MSDINDFKEITQGHLERAKVLLERNGKCYMDPCCGECPFLNNNFSRHCLSLTYPEKIELLKKILDHGIKERD